MVTNSRITIIILDLHILLPTLSYGVAINCVIFLLFFFTFCILKACQCLDLKSRVFCTKLLAPNNQKHFWRMYLASSFPWRVLYLPSFPSVLPIFFIQNIFVPYPSLPPCLNCKAVLKLLKNSANKPSVRAAILNLCWLFFFLYFSHLQSFLKVSKWSTILGRNRERQEKCAWLDWGVQLPHYYSRYATSFCHFTK